MDSCSTHVKAGYLYAYLFYFMLFILFYLI